MAKALGYANTRDAIKKHVDTQDKVFLAENKVSQNATANFQNYGNVFINESGLFSLIHGKRRRVDACDAILF